MEENNDIRAELAALAGAATELDGGAPLDTQAANDDELGAEAGMVYAEPATAYPPADPDMKGAIATAATMVTGLAMPNWEIKPEEIDTVSEQAARCVALYWPDADATKLMNHPGIGLALAVAVVAMPRVMEKRPLKITEGEGENAPVDSAQVKQEKTLKEDALNVG